MIVCADSLHDKTPHWHGDEFALAEPRLGICVATANSRFREDNFGLSRSVAGRCNEIRNRCQVWLQAKLLQIACSAVAKYAMPRGLGHVAADRMQEIDEISPLEPLPGFLKGCRRRGYMIAPARSWVPNPRSATTMAPDV